MSYLLMGTTTLFEMQVNNFDKLVQSLEEVGFYGKAAGYKEVA